MLDLVRYPIVSVQGHKKFQFYTSYLLKAIVTYYSLTILAVAIILLFDEFVTKPLLGYSIRQELRSFSTRILSDDELYMYLGVVIIGPLIEELIFRKFLSMSRRDILISLYFLLFKLSGVKFIDIYNLTDMFLFTGLILAIFFYLILCIIRGFDFSYDFRSSQKRFFYLSSILFGLVHLYNFDNITFFSLPFYLIYISPQIILGLVLANVRLQISFYSSWFTHSLVNLISVVI